MVGASCTANADPDIVTAKIILGQLLALFAEGGREHHVSVVRAFAGIWLM